MYSSCIMYLFNINVVVQFCQQKLLPISGKMSQKKMTLKKTQFINLSSQVVNLSAGL